MSGASFGKGVFTDGIKLRIVLEMSSPWIILACYDKDPSERKTDDSRQDGAKDTLTRSHTRKEAEAGVRPPQAPRPREAGRALLEPPEEAWAHQPPQSVRETVSAFLSPQVCDPASQQT